MITDDTERSQPKVDNKSKEATAAAAQEESETGEKEEKEEEYRTQSNHTPMNDDAFLLRTKLIGASISHVKEFGWTKESILKAVQTEFPNYSYSFASTITPYDLISALMNQWNEELSSRMIRQQQQQEESNSLLLVDLIVDALKFRLNCSQEYRSIWHEAMAIAITTAPQQTTQQILQSIQIVTSNTSSTTIQSTDQFTLAAIYVATEFHLLTDTSPNQRDTWKFLHCQVQQWDAMRNITKNNLNPFNQNTINMAYILANAFASGILSVIRVSPDHIFRVIPNLSLFTQTTMDKSKDGTKPNHYRGEEFK